MNSNKILTQIMVNYNLYGINCLLFAKFILKIINKNTAIKSP